MNVRILFFGKLRRDVGQSELELTLTPTATVRDAATALEAQLSLSLAGHMAAVNENYASPEHLLEAGDTVAFLPPVAGG
jgi:MoaE-MoaD fusion protein